MEPNDKLAQALLEAAREIEGRKRLTCAEAFELARRLGVPISRIGRVCDDNNIKISNCQLGCFK